MRSSWRVALEKLLPEYKHLSSSGAAFSAVVKLGTVLAMADEEELHDATAAVRDHVTAAVLSIGTKFSWDELVLVLTMRIELELASSVMALFGIDTTAFDLGTLDAELREVGSLKENRVRFASALATIRRNWGVPILDRWST
jgi:hypothetical protein